MIQVDQDRSHLNECQSPHDIGGILVQDRPSNRKDKIRDKTHFGKIKIIKSY